MIPSPKTDELDPRPASLDEHRELLRRILASQAFSRSERLSSFLSYIAELALAGRAGEINEQRIGEAVFGRPSGYDSTIDGIVRTQATRLRQRLDLYFSTEGANETLRLSVPRGRYVPVFERTLPESAEVSVLPAPAAPEVDAASSPVSSPLNRQQRSLALWLVAALVCIAGAILLVHAQSHSSASVSATASRDPLWTRMFSPDRATLIVPGDSSLVIWEMLRSQDVGLAAYLSGQYRQVLPGDSHSIQNLAAGLSNLRYTSIVDLEVAQSLSRMAETHGSGIEVRYARDVRPNDLKSGNAVLVGNDEANPWVSLFEQEMNFVFASDFSRHIYSVVNRHPHANEPDRWSFAGPDPQHHVYAVVAYVANLSGNGNVLILEGTSMAGTECAWDFVSDTSQLLPFLQRIRRPDGTIPHFEVVLGSNNMGGSAVRAATLAWRIDH